MSKEFLTFRFGFVAVKKGFATPEQVASALEAQIKENVSVKKHRRIGEIMVEMGLMNTDEVREVLDDMSVSA
ncbi:MAG: hypothetical protein IH584_02275 [Candidatus Aminicenantes bacterium]|nr:hypothetical protein [Candidatus Aminicenantes bacterium]